MLKPKYGNEVAFVMGNIVASYGGQLEKKAQWLSGEQDNTGGPVDMDHSVSDTIDENLEDPTILSGKGAGLAASVPGNHESLLAQQDKEKAIDAELDQLNKEYAKQIEPVTLEDPGGKLTMPVDGGLPVRENPFEKPETVKIDFDANDPFGAEHLFESESLKPEKVEGPTPAQVPKSDWPTAAGLVLDRIQKIAGYLGETGDVRSELIADELLRSVIRKLTK